MACPWGPALWPALFGQALGLHGLLQEAVWPALFGQALWPALFGQALWPAPGGRRCGLPLGAGVVACRFCVRRFCRVILARVMTCCRSWLSARLSFWGKALKNSRR